MMRSSFSAVYDRKTIHEKRQGNRKMYRIETHAHTSEASKCGKATGAEMARFYKSEGYDGMFVTDHFFNGNTAISRELPYAERVGLFYRGYENAKAEGDRIGLDVFPGFEFNCGATEFLVYNTTKEWMISYPDLPETDLSTLYRRVHEAGGFVVHAHPFRQRSYIKMIRLLPDCADAVETLNSAHPADSPFDARARWYAESYGLPETAGSDNHVLTPVRLSGMEFDTPVLGGGDYAQKILAREGRQFVYNYNGASASDAG